MWQWGIDGREGYFGNTLAKSPPKFRSIEANGNEFGVVRSTVGALTEVLF